MKNQELFAKDPLTWNLVNEGVSKNDDDNPATLRYEFETFVCDGEYHTGLSKILEGYLGNLGREQKAAWISGFYGSGKSHLVKILRYIWNDFKFMDGMTARTLVSLPADIREKLTELSTRGKQHGGLHSAGGTLKAGIGSVRLRVLGIIFKSAGFPEKISNAKLLMDLRDENALGTLEEYIRNAGKELGAELDRLYTSKTFHEAYLNAFPHHKDIKTVGDALRAQYPAKTEEISIDDMILLIRRAIATKSQLPCTVIVLDEVQQFINNSADTALEVQEIVEACSKKLDGRVLFVGTGQSALSDTPALQKLMGRFTIKVHLRDNDVEKVVRTVVLQKKDSCKKNIADICSRYAGEITRQLKDTKIATKTEDDDSYVPDYPLLPVRKRFWEQVLHSVDTTGTSAQMRTQLRVTHEACRSIANRELGAIIPADFLYSQLCNELVMSGEMQKRFQEIIEEQKSKQDGELRSRICSLVFLINKLPQEDADIGLRANSEHIADLLTDDIGQSASQIRQNVPEVVKQLLSDGILMEVEGEYRLQTTEGAAWESEYRRRRAGILNNDPQIASMRSRLLLQGIQDHLARLNVLHGEAREKRDAILHYSMEHPQDTDSLIVWVRDGFQESDNSVIQSIQRKSIEDATIHMLIPKTKTEELKQAIASSLAADETVNFKGNPSSNEGKEARSSMLTRKSTEENRTKDLIQEIIGNARVFLSGGQELSVIDLHTTVKEAAEQVLDRLYPKFKIADSSNWSVVWKKAKEGNVNALQSIGYNGDPDKHPVASEILLFIGAGRKGSEVLAKYTKGVYGWPKDAIDATLAVLMVSGHIGGSLQNGQAAKLPDLDQRKISQVNFRVEHPVLTAPQKLRIRKLYQEIGVQFQPGDESSSSQNYIQTMVTLARSTGGDPPLPEAPHDPLLAELSRKTGNDLLFELFEKAEDLSGKSTQWKKASDQIRLRLPHYEMTRRLLSHSLTLEDCKQHESALDAIESQRTLLDNPDPVIPILKATGTMLRTALHSAVKKYKDVFGTELNKLESNSVWEKLSKEKKTEILVNCDICECKEPDVGSDDKLEAELNACGLSHWQTLADALPTRFGQAIDIAIKESEPKAVRISLPSATIHNKDEMEKWLIDARTCIDDKLKKGPVII